MTLVTLISVAGALCAVEWLAMWRRAVRAERKLAEYHERDRHEDLVR